MHSWARWRAAAPLCALLLPALVSAQAPVITPAGDPSVRSDTIYALAVDPADYPEDTGVLLLDDGVLIIDRDGSGTLTYRQVVQLQPVTKERQQLIKRQLKAGGAVARVKDTKRWSGCSTKRFVYLDGSTRPWTVAELEAGEHLEHVSPLAQLTHT